MIQYLTAGVGAVGCVQHSLFWPLPVADSPLFRGGRSMISR